MNTFIQGYFLVCLKLRSIKKIRRNVCDAILLLKILGELCWKLWRYNWRDNICLAVYFETTKWKKITSWSLPQEKYYM